MKKLEIGKWYYNPKSCKDFFFRVLVVEDGKSYYDVTISQNNSGWYRGIYKEKWEDISCIHPVNPTIWEEVSVEDIKKVVTESKYATCRFEHRNSGEYGYHSIVGELAADWRTDIDDLNYIFDIERKVQEQDVRDEECRQKRIVSMKKEKIENIERMGFQKGIEANPIDGYGTFKYSKLFLRKMPDGGYFAIDLENNVFIMDIDTDNEFKQNDRKITLGKKKGYQIEELIKLLF